MLYDEYDWPNLHILSESSLWSAALDITADICQKQKLAGKTPAETVAKFVGIKIKPELGWGPASYCLTKHLVEIHKEFRPILASLLEDEEESNNGGI